MQKWKRATNYLGDDYFEYYVIYTRHRDSDVLNNANFEAALEMLGGERSNKVIVVRASEWRVGWVEAILVHEKAKKYLAIAKEIEQQLKKYPVLNDQLYSDMQREQYDRDYDSWASEQAAWILEDNGIKDEDIIDEVLYDAVMDTLFDGGRDGLDERELVEKYQYYYDKYRDRQITEYEQKVGQRKLFQ